MWFSNRRARWRKIACAHHQQQHQSHHIPNAPSPLMLSTGPTTISSVNISGQSTPSSRFHFNPFCLSTIGPSTTSPTGQFSSLSSSSFHPSSECSSSGNTTTILFGSQQQQPSQPSFYHRYTNGSFIIIISSRKVIKISSMLAFSYLDYDNIYRSSGSFPYSTTTSNNIMMHGQVLGPTPLPPPPPPSPRTTTASSSSFYTPNIFDIHNIYL